ncbi:MAG: GatB/YqeY domain-containing protein, partial [Actinobacteria bacterium]|nr:GatB/YqeY domain-containing protein [Actinomycetota bacterium]
MTDLSSAAISEMIKQAMKSGDKLRLSVLRLLMSAVKNAEVAKMDQLTHDEALGIVAKEARKREEAAVDFEKAGRQDRAAAERSEAVILNEFLPAQLSTDELSVLVAESIAEANANSASDIGAVMKVLMPKVRGRADGKAVSDAVRTK